MKDNNGIRKVQKIVITRKKEKLLTFENIYIKVKPDAIDISDYEDFRFLMYFPLDEVKKFVIKE
jgi:hypothetical protein